jgi:hypothetical protein
MPTGLRPHTTRPLNSEEPEDSQHQMTAGEATLNIVNRLLRSTGMAERSGVAGVLNQLEIAPIPQGAVIPLCNSICKAAILDSGRIEQGIPLVYIWLETYLLAQKGAKRFAFMIKDLASEQLAGKGEEINGGEEGE